MEEKGFLSLDLVVSEVQDDSLCALCFGISSALFALKFLSAQESDNRKCFETKDKLLLGSAHLLGFLGWRVYKEVKNLQKCKLLHKLQAAEREINELKRRRSEDAKANEKVVSIYALQKHSWFTEKRNLQQQIGGLMSDFRILDKRKHDAISKLNGKLRETEILMKSKDKMLEEVNKKRKELEEKLKSMEVDLEDLREAMKREAEDHSSELLKHKTAFIELVSNQRQLEAELGRALRQLKATKEQLHYILEEKDEAVLMAQELSVEIEKMRKDTEKKDKMLSAMMQRPKIGMSEKQMLMKEVKLNKPKKKKVDIETERWWTISVPRSERCTLRHLFSRQVSSRLEVDRTKSDQNDKLYDDLDVNVQDGAPFLNSEQNLPQESTDLGDAARLEEWVHLEAEKCQAAIQKKHQLELHNFAEQMRLKDDKLEAYQWQLLSTELVSKRSKTTIEGLNKDVSKLRHDNSKLEAMLLDREGELKTLKGQIASKMNNFNAEKSKNEEESVAKDGSSTVISTTDAIEEKEVVVQVNQTDVCIEVSSPEGFETCRKIAAANQCLNKTGMPMGKMDLHALGISYKIKRLNQQLLMLERLTGKQQGVEVKGKDEHGRTKMKSFLLLLSLLSKQVSRYQSLQEKTDALSHRMGEKEMEVKQEVSNLAKKKQDTKTLENFLEETFQLQRFIVATGQKLMEIQPKIAPGFVGISEELDVSASFDMNKFADTIRTLLKDVQRGFEVRVSRIIGDLEGTLACDGIHSRS